MKLFFLLILAACSFKKKPLGNQVQNGHQELYSSADLPKLATLTADQKRVVIAATNDTEGFFSPQVVEFKDKHNGTQSIKMGGADALAAYVNILREHYQNVLLVESGDLLSTRATLKETQQFYESLKYDALTLGLGDFNLKLPAGIKSTAQLFQTFAKDSAASLVISNLYELKTARHIEWKGTHPYLLKEINGVKIGIIGLIPDDIANLTPVDNRVGLFVENMLQSTLRQARLLRSLGADLIVVLTHQGTPCGHELASEAKLPLMKVNFVPEQKGVCNTSSALGAYLERLPPHLVDVVVGGRHHEKMANYINETLVLSSFGQGKSLSFAEFIVDTKTKKIVREKTVVHQPVLLCREFFKETKDCYTGDSSVNHKERMPALFLGKPLALNESAEVSYLDQPLFIEAEKARLNFEADLSYRPSSYHSQLLLIEISGVELEQLLEEEFNHDKASFWHPSPYRTKGHEILLSVNGDEIDQEKNYRILVDLEGAQEHWKFRSQITAQNTRVLSEHAWSDFDKADTVKTVLSGPQR
jgi:hypothetical protein